ncbi:MAG: hypothetical protein A4E41_00360 [Methanoregulaceae archaeon PtaU1.Bin066]|jgi:hypothetical protein|nr:MAG: hypothetical protein A4E41_00360 [Methanoregulaceae archaeon PtaU1.Bin066]
MPLLPCRDHTIRIAALENQMQALVRLIEGMNGVTAGIIENMKKPELPGLDPSLEAYHR